MAVTVSDVVAETLPDTVNEQPVTDRELRSRLDHQDEILHAMWGLLQKIASPENLAALDALISNPAFKWKLRHKSG